MNNHADVAQAELLNLYLARQYRRSYRYGICLLMVGALMNWVGFAQTYLLPIRYIGIACVMAGTICVGAAMCKWAKTPAIVQEPPTPEPSSSVVNLPSKPPEYSTVAPPSYEEAILLNPAGLLNMGKPQDAAPKPHSSPPSSSRDFMVDVEGEKNGETVLSFEDSFVEQNQPEASVEPKVETQK